MPVVLRLPHEGQEPPEEPVEDAGTARTAAEKRRLRRLSILLPLLFLLAFLAWGFTTNYIPSRSMEPTLREGDHILTMRAWLAYPRGRMPARGDIITFVPPELALMLEPEEDRSLRPEVWIKRVVGLPGETIWIFGGQVYVNGAPLPRSFYQGRPNLYPAPYPFATIQPLQLGSDELFVLGDNPEMSDDSRTWGPVKRELVVGKFVAVLFHEGPGGINRRRAAAESRT